MAFQVGGKAGSQRVCGRGARKRAHGVRCRYTMEVEVEPTKAPAVTGIMIGENGSIFCSKKNSWVNRAAGVGG